jgi:radical SAM protein with 4Fe4S-binding SPASM domain
MKDMSSGHFSGKLRNKKEHYPWQGQIELTYGCNLNCVHCYCKGLENRKSGSENRELIAIEWKKILDEIHREGCLWLCFTGGEPLIRDDFLEIYSYAKKKGFIITVFTNAIAFSDKMLNHLAKSPPYSIEISLNGITRHTYETITQTKGSFLKAMENIKKIKEKGLPLIIKSNCLKQNKREIARIKAFVDEFLGKAKGKYYFKYDPLIFPRLDADTRPCNYRLSFEEILEFEEQDADIRQEYREVLHRGFPELGRDDIFLYQCDTWMTQFCINPYGRLKFCQLTEDFSSDLRKVTFADGFYNTFPKLLLERFRTDSKCRSCSLRPICYSCPAKAYLETGNRENPVFYYCESAMKLAEHMQQVQQTQ